MHFLILDQNTKKKSSCFEFSITFLKHDLILFSRYRNCAMMILVFQVTSLHSRNCIRCSQLCMANKKQISLIDTSTIFEQILVNFDQSQNFCFAKSLFNEELKKNVFHRKLCDSSLGFAMLFITFSLVNLLIYGNVAQLNLQSLQSLPLWLLYTRTRSIQCFHLIFSILTGSKWKVEKEEKWRIALNPFDLFVLY